MRKPQSCVWKAIKWPRPKTCLGDWPQHGDMRPGHVNIQSFIDSFIFCSSLLMISGSRWLEPNMSTCWSHFIQNNVGVLPQLRCLLSLLNVQLQSYFTFVVYRRRQANCLSLCNWRPCDKFSVHAFHLHEHDMNKIWHGDETERHANLSSSASKFCIYTVPASPRKETQYFYSFEFTASSAERRSQHIRKMQRELEGSPARTNYWSTLTSAAAASVLYRRI